MALAPLIPVVIALGCLIIAGLLTVLTLALINVLKDAPVIGGWIANKAVAIEQGISGAIGRALSGVDGLIGGAIHHLAHYADNLWGEVREQARVLEALASSFAATANVGSVVRDLTRGLHRAVHYLGGQVGTLARDFKGIEHRVKTLERDISKGIGHDVLPRLRSLDKEVAKIENSTIPAIRQAEAEAASSISNLYDWIKGKADIAGVGYFAAAVTAVLALVGNGWLACKENPFSKSNTPCNLWADFARFLPFLGLLALAFDFPEFVKAAELVAEEIGPSVSRIEGTFVTSLDPLPPPV